MPAGAVIGGVISAGASIIGGNKAAKAQKQASDAAVAEQRRQFDLTRADQAPWLEAGRNALIRLQDPAAFTADPGYQFTRSEGLRGIDQSAAARGGALSGNALKALNEYNANLADQTYGNWWNRQAGLAGVGQSAAQNLGALGQQSAANIGNALMAGGNARASGYANAANAIGGLSSMLANNYMYFNQPQTSGGSMWYGRK
jgi:hypothetical protein